MGVLDQLIWQPNEAEEQPENPITTMVKHQAKELEILGNRGVILNEGTAEYPDEQSTVMTSPANEEGPNRHQKVPLSKVGEAQRLGWVFTPRPIVERRQDEKDYANVGWENYARHALDSFSNGFYSQLERSKAGGGGLGGAILRVGLGNVGITPDDSKNPAAIRQQKVNQYAPWYSGIGGDLTGSAPYAYLSGGLTNEVAGALGGGTLAKVAGGAAGGTAQTLQSLATQSISGQHLGVESVLIQLGLGGALGGAGGFFSKYAPTVGSAVKQRMGDLGKQIETILAKSPSVQTAGERLGNVARYGRDMTSEDVARSAANQAAVDQAVKDLIPEELHVQTSVVRPGDSELAAIHAAEDRVHGLPSDPTRILRTPGYKRNPARPEKWIQEAQPGEELSATVREGQAAPDGAYPGAAQAGELYPGSELPAYVRGPREPLPIGKSMREERAKAGYVDGPRHDALLELGNLQDEFRGAAGEFSDAELSRLDGMRRLKLNQQGEHVPGYIEFSDPADAAMQFVATKAKDVPSLITGTEGVIAGLRREAKVGLESAAHTANIIEGKLTKLKDAVARAENPIRSKVDQPALDAARAPYDQAVGTQIRMHNQDWLDAMKQRAEAGQPLVIPPPLSPPGAVERMASAAYNKLAPKAVAAGKALASPVATSIASTIVGGMLGGPAMAGAAGLGMTFLRLVARKAIKSQLMGLPEKLGIDLGKAVGRIGAGIKAGARATGNGLGYLGRAAAASAPMGVRGFLDAYADDEDQ